MIARRTTITRWDLRVQNASVVICRRKPLSTEICKAVKQYIQNLNDETDLVAEDSEWNKFIQNATKEQLYEMSRVICGLNDRIVRKVCQ